VRETEPVGPDSRRRFRQESFCYFQWILEFGKTLRIYTRRFRRNFDVGIFPKSFLDPQGF
jgi:hypothetical protein